MRLYFFSDRNILNYMNTKKVLTSIGIGLVVLVIAFFAVFGSSLKNLKQETVETPVVTEPATQTTTTTATPSKTPTPTSTPTTAAGYTLVDVAKHNSATSCWSAIDGNVYDLTNWVNSHPGGKAAILMIQLGEDATANLFSHMEIDVVTDISKFIATAKTIDKSVANDP